VIGPRRGFDVAYRPLFAAGAVHAVVFVGLWFALVEARRAGAVPLLAPAIPPAWIHAHMMIFGTLTLYIFGFLGTAFPRWVSAAPPTPPRILTWLVLLTVAQLALAAALVVGCVLVALAAALEAAAFLSLLSFLVVALRAGGPATRIQPPLVLAAVALAPVALSLDGVAVLLANPWLHAAAIEIALRGFLLLVVVGVCFRVVPFFTANVLGRPPAPQPEIMLIGWGGLAAARLAVSLAARAIPEATSLGAICDSGLALVLGWELFAWRPGRALRNPMIAVLYVGLGWIVLALAGSAVAGLVPELASPLELPVRHALAIGGFATLVIGMSTRVALGHRGRPIRADAWIVASFASIQLAALVRVALPLLGGVAPRAPVLAHWAALPWMAAFALWIARIGPVLISVPTAVVAPPR